MKDCNGKSDGVVLKEKLTNLAVVTAGSEYKHLLFFYHFKYTELLKNTVYSDESQAALSRTGRVLRMLQHGEEHLSRIMGNHCCFR